MAHYFVMKRSSSNEFEADGSDDDDDDDYEQDVNDWLQKSSQFPFVFNMALYISSWRTVLFSFFFVYI